jgi:RND family efflux transporter MFP subunit
VALERSLAVNQAALREARAEKQRLVAAAERDKALLAEAEAVYNSLLPLSREVVPQVEVDKALHTRDARAAALDATGKQAEVVAATVSRFEAEVAAARRQLELKVNLKRRLEEAKASVAEAEARLAEAKLRLARMAVVSPAAGTVINRLVAPGAKVRQAMDGATSAHIVHLYDPARLQVRTDVPLADAAKVGLGQEARIVVDVLPEHEFTGRVARFVHQADISKNTGQVKVSVESPTAQLKPDMLARVKFLARAPAGRDSPENSSGNAVRVFAHQSALREEGGRDVAWVVDPQSSKVERRPVSVGLVRRGEWLEVKDGLQAGDLLVYQPPPSLPDGGRVRLVGEVSP